MPTYDYLCEANGRVVEVSHKMSDQVVNWGELCQRAGIARGKTPAGSPVQKLITGGAVISGVNLGSTERSSSTRRPAVRRLRKCFAAWRTGTRASASTRP